MAAEYLGPPDKPVQPVVITSGKPSRTTLRTLLSSRSDPEFVELILLPEAEVRRLADEVRLSVDRFGSVVSNTALAPISQFQLQVANLADFATPPNFIAPGSQTTFITGP